MQYAAPPDRVHLWIGVADRTATPTVQWKLDGNAVTPNAVLRRLTPVLEGDLAHEARTKVFSGIFEFRGLAPDSTHRVEVRADGELAERVVRVLPAAVPQDPQDSLNVLLVSCFHRLEDKTGAAGSALARLKVRPHLTLLTGDQVYLDLPTTADFPDRAAWLADKFQNDYLDNWLGHRDALPDPRVIHRGFPEILALAPCAFIPDDHEFWNNYPEWTTPVRNSWTEDGRAHWTRAAKAAYLGFQQAGSSQFGEAQTLHFEPLSILLLDTRSQRTPGSLTKGGDLLGTNGRGALTAWVNRLIASASTTTPRFGMLVTGQSLFSPAAGSVKGAIADYEFADYTADYVFMREQLERLTRVGLPAILATGDVHWSRVLAAIDPSTPGAPLFEVISSPLSLVSTILVDQAKTLFGRIKGVFAGRDPWLRHSEPASPPDRFGTRKQYASAVLSRDGDDEKKAAMRGNSALMFRFSRLGAGLEVTITCYPLSSDEEFNARHQWSTRFRLRPQAGGMSS